MMRARFFLFVLGLASLAAAARAQSGWIEIDPRPQSKTLRAVQCIDPSTVVALGDSGTFLRSSDGGARWAVSNGLGLGFFGLRAMSFPAWPIGYIAGDSGAVFRTTDGGDTWRRLASAGTLDLHCASFYDASNGVVAGDTVGIFRTTDGGASWKKQVNAIPLFGSRRIDRIQLLSDAAGFAIAGNGMMYRCSGIGSLWTMINTLEGLELDALWFTSPANGFVAGRDGFFLHTTDAGDAWEQVLPPTRSALKDIVFPSRGIGYAVGAGGTILRSNDAGGEWFPEVCGARLTLRAVSFSGNNNGFIVGDSGVILKTTTGGLVEAPAPAAPDDRAFAVVAVAPHPIAASAGPGTVRVRYLLNRGARVQLHLVNALGEAVATLEENLRTVGENTATLGVRDLPAGWYAIRAIVDGRTYLHPVIVIR